MHLNFKCHIKKQANNEVSTFANSNYIEGLWLVLNYYVKHVDITVPGDEREVDYLMESDLGAKLHHYLHSIGKSKQNKNL